MIVAPLGQKRSNDARDILDLFVVEPDAKRSACTVDDRLGEIQSKRHARRVKPAPAFRPSGDRRWKEEFLAHPRREPGERSGITGVEPPDTYGPDVWAELLRTGRLVDGGHHMVELPPE